MVNLDVLNVQGLSASLEESGDYTWVRLIVEGSDGQQICMVFHPGLDATRDGFAASKVGVERLKAFFGLSEVGVSRAA